MHIAGRKEGRKDDIHDDHDESSLGQGRIRQRERGERGGRREGEERERERDRVITYWEVGRSLGGHASAISACIYYGGRGTDRMGQGLTGDDGA